MAKETTGDQAQAPGQPVQAIQPTIEPETLEPIYTNFARVTGSPEELILDFGLNTQPIGNPNLPVKVSQRLVMNYYTAKRLFMTLGVSLQRHEATFGVLETDIGKRVIPQSQSSTR
ncbi:MAG: DUF3467 domain-containing protein [Planctomycetaceae bacterium]